jgi:hypothetical protein
MPPVVRHKSVFLREASSCRVLFRHCLTPRGPHSDAGVEAAFLQLFKAWESLLEEITLSYMCGRLRCDGSFVPSSSVSKDEEAARRMMYQERAFVEWTDIEKIKARWTSIFNAGNVLEQALRPASSELRQMNVVRNAIAHSSQRATIKFNDLVQGHFGGHRRLQRPAELLIASWPKDPTQTFFDRYADILETIVPTLTG